MPMWQVFNRHNTCVWQGQALTESEAWELMFRACRYPQPVDVELEKSSGLRIVEYV